MERGESRGGRVVSRNTCSTFTASVREGRARREGGAMRRGVGIGGMRSVMSVTSNR